MSEIKVSDKLLSWVTGYKCEFKELIFGRTISFEKVDISRPGADINKVNIYQFIHLAKIKAFKCGYDIESSSYKSKVKTRNDLGQWRECKVFRGSNDYFSSIREIICLEWVAEKVGGDG